jgi:dTDP-4-amino-4,6-dideoxygalactose transaminase
MRVSMHNHAAEYRSLKVEVDEALQRVLEGGRLDWGAEVPAFETEFAQFVGVKHAVGTNSGTAALKLALLALEIGPGDEIITVPNSDISSTSAIHHVGAQAVWVDVEPDTFNMDPSLVEAAITSRTRAILPVHLYGHPADMPALQAIAERHNLWLIEDACLALGASIDGQPVGTWGHLACFSHAPSKHLGAYGSGGTVVTDDASLIERVQLYAGYGQPRERTYSGSKVKPGQLMLVEGLNERLDELQAAILRAKLPHLSNWLEMRRNHAQAYSAAFQGSAIEPPVERRRYCHTYRNYIIRVPERDQVLQKLVEAEIAAGLLYVPPLHLQPAYERFGFKRGSFPVTEAVCDALISIPVGPGLTETQRSQVIETLLAICQGLS